MSIGTIKIHAGNTIPEGYLVCNGSAVSRSTYSELFNVIGTTYGAGDGNTTFNLPNMSGSVGIGPSLTHLIGNTGGESSVVLTSGEMPLHLHNVGVHGHDNNIVATTPSLAHTITQPAFNYNRVNTATSYTSSRGLYFKTGRSGATNMSRATNVAISDHPATDCTMSGGVTDCPAFDTETAGSGDAHNNMMPYIALVYLIQAEPDIPPGPVIPSMVLYNGAMPVGPSGCYIAGRR